jgi:transposase
MAKRYELTAEQFRLIEALLPARGKRGGRWNDHHTTLNGIFWWLYSGAQWREVPERYGKWKSLYDRFTFWRADGTFDRILERLHLHLNAEGRLDYSLWSVDATSIRASRAAAGAARGKKSGARRTAGSRVGPLPRRLRHQNPSGR